MLLGIVYHVSLSFALGFGWMVQDNSQGKVPFVFQAFVHGFRMQLFMLVSGFFTAMLWRQKGLKALLWHRCQRVLFPCLLGLVTVVPAMVGSVTYAIKSGAAQKEKNVRSEAASTHLWAAIRKGDASALKEHLKNPAALTQRHPDFGITPLTWAAIQGQREMALILLDHGAKITDRDRDGGTALHAAAFLGRAEMVELLLQRGMDVNASNNDGDVPLKSASYDFGTVEYIAGILGTPVDKAKVEQGRALLVPMLRAAGARDVLASDGGLWGRCKAAYQVLTEKDVFILVWFLWFLVWLIGVFAVAVSILPKLGIPSLPRGWILSSSRLLWLVPLSFVPGWFMGFGNGEFGPDTAMGILPMPHVLLYYAVFFFFGVLYYEAEDSEGHLGSCWRWSLPVTLLLVFPLALECATGTFGWRDRLIPSGFEKPISVFFQSLYAWLMCFGVMGLFRSCLTRESSTLRYLSDSSYWLYLAHLPLTIVAQALISQLPGSYWIKLPLLSLILILFLLLTYHYLVRYTWIGRMLNGPRKRPDQAHPSLETPPRNVG